MKNKPPRENEPSEKKWRGGVYLCTAANSFEAEIFESKLRGENIPCMRRHRGAGNYLEVFMGTDAAFPIDLYVPGEALEDAKNILIAVPLEECEPVDFDSMSDEELDALVGSSSEEEQEDR